MSKIQLRWIILGAVLLALFNILFFLWGGDLSITSVWISYAFIHVAYIIVFLAPFIIPKGKNAHVFLESTALISSVYFLVEFCIGIIFILFKPKAWEITLSIQLVIFVICLCALFINAYANKHTSSIEKQRKSMQKVIKTGVISLTHASSVIDEKEKTYILSLLNDLKSSPLVANESLCGIENNIQSECEAIDKAAAEGNIDALHMHGAVLSQLILLRKQTPT